MKKFIDVLKSIFKNDPDIKKIQRLINTREINSTYSVNVNSQSNVSQQPIKKEIIVYTNQSSRLYHKNPHCSGITDVIKMGINDAKRIGLKPCKRCCK